MDTRLLENSEQNKLKGTAPLNYCYRASVQTARKNSNSPTQTKRDGSCELIEKDCTKKNVFSLSFLTGKGAEKNCGLQNLVKGVHRGPGHHFSHLRHQRLMTKCSSSTYNLGKIGSDYARCFRA